MFARLEERGMKILGVESVFLWVSDVESSIRFYRTILGVEPKQLAPNLVSIDIEGTKLMLHGDGEKPRFALEDRRGLGLTLHIQVTGIFELWDYLETEGIILGERPTFQPYGFTEFSVHDPDGYEIEFVEWLKGA